MYVMRGDRVPHMTIQDNAECVTACVTQLQRAVSLRQKVQAAGNLITAMDTLYAAVDWAVRASITDVLKVEKRNDS